MGSHSNQFGGNHSNPSSNIYYPFEGTANAAENGLTHAGEICVVADGTRNKRKNTLFESIFVTTANNNDAVVDHINTSLITPLHLMCFGNVSSMCCQR